MNPDTIPGKIEAIQHLFSDLEQKLNPVLLPQAASLEASQGTLTSAVPTSPVMSQLDTLIDRLIQLNARIQI